MADRVVPAPSRVALPVRRCIECAASFSACRRRTCMPDGTLTVRPSRQYALVHAGVAVCRRGIRGPRDRRPRHPTSDARHRVGAERCRHAGVLSPRGFPGRVRVRSARSERALRFETACLRATTARVLPIPRRSRGDCALRRRRSTGVPFSAVLPPLRGCRAAGRVPRSSLRRSARLVRRSRDGRGLPHSIAAVPSPVASCGGRSSCRGCRADAVTIRGHLARLTPGRTLRSRTAGSVRSGVGTHRSAGRSRPSQWAAGRADRSARSSRTAAGCW